MVGSEGEHVGEEAEAGAVQRRYRGVHRAHDDRAAVARRRQNLGHLFQNSVWRRIRQEMVQPVRPCLQRRRSLNLILKTAVSQICPQSA